VTAPDNGPPNNNGSFGTGFIEGFLTVLAWRLWRSLRSWDQYVHGAGRRASYGGWRAYQAEASARHKASPRLHPQAASIAAGVGVTALAIDALAAHNGIFGVMALGAFIVSWVCSRHTAGM